MEMVEVEMRMKMDNGLEKRKNFQFLVLMAAVLYAKVNLSSHLWSDHCADQLIYLNSSRALFFAYTDSLVYNYPPSLIYVYIVEISLISYYLLP